MPSESSRLALLIDGANLSKTTKALGFEIDYKRLLQGFHGRGMLLRAYYFTAESEDQEFSPVRPLIDWLDYNGYTVVVKKARELVDAMGRRKIRGRTSVDLAVTALELVDYIDELVLVSGDGDFCSLVTALQRCGVRVTVVSTLASQPPIVADELRRQADHFIEINELRSNIGRELAQGPPPKTFVTVRRPSPRVRAPRETDAPDVSCAIERLRQD